MKTLTEPMRYVNGWRLLNGCFLIYLWAVGQYEASVFVLILLLLLFASLRWRFDWPARAVLLDVLVCCLYMPHAAIGYYGLALPIFELALRGRWPYALAIFISLFAAPFDSGWLLWYFVLALFLGLFCHASLRIEQRFKQEADEQRRARYELERIRTDLLEANQSVSQQAELMERYRIARQLHDHLGHDLTGAALALEAYEYVQEPEEARKLLEEVKRRLALSTRSLRETVHNATPTALIGVENLEYAARNFRQADVRYRQSGNLLDVPAHHWGLLEACLKEALTNVARHSNATEVSVKVQASESIVRLFVHDNGTAPPQGQAGSGLRSLQMRARALGGSLSVSAENGYLLVCVLPLREGEGSDEAADR